MTERKKRILIFAHYYAPDTASTGQILRDLAEGLREEFEVTDWSLGELNFHTLVVIFLPKISAWALVFTNII